MPRVSIHKSQGRIGDHQCVSCSNPIVKGQEYYQWALKRQRGGVVKRQHAFHGSPKASQPTESKLSGAYAAIEEAQVTIANASNVEEIEDALQQCASDINSVADEYQESFDAIPENLQQGGPAQEIEEKIQALQDFANELEGLSLDEDAFDDGDAQVDPETGVNDFDYDTAEPTNLQDNKDAAEQALDEFSL